MTDALKRFMRRSLAPRAASGDGRAALARPGREWPCCAMLDGIRSYLSGREAPMLESIARLCEVNSYTEAPAGGAQVAAMLAAELGSIEGVSVRTLPSERFAPHLVA